MKRYAIFFLFMFQLTAANFAFAQPFPIDLHAWTQEGPLKDGVWKVSQDGKAVKQTINGSPTFFVAPEPFINTRVTGRVKVLTEEDDDWFGFVWGFQDTNEFYLLDWKQEKQNGAPQGIVFSHISNGKIPWSRHHISQPDIGYEVLWSKKEIGWKAEATYEFVMDYTTTAVHVDIKRILEHENREILSFSVIGDFPAGRFGFYNRSQEGVQYQGFYEEKILEAIPFLTELVINGNAETGDTSGWISTGIEAKSPDTWAQGHGSFSFTGAEGPASAQTLRQSISIASLVPYIDNGEVVSTFGIFLQTRQNDMAEATLSFMDKNGSVLYSAFFQDSSPFNAYDWDYQEDVRVVPEGTRDIEIILTSYRDGGTSSDGFFDDVSLKLSRIYCSNINTQAAIAYTKILQSYRDGLSLLTGEVQPYNNVLVIPCALPEEVDTLYRPDAIPPIDFASSENVDMHFLYAPDKTIQVITMLDRDAEIHWMHDAQLESVYLDGVQNISFQTIQAGTALPFRANDVLVFKIGSEEFWGMTATSLNALGQIEVSVKQLTDEAPSCNDTKPPFRPTPSPAPASPIPEPSTLILLSLGIFGLFGVAKRATWRNRHLLVVFGISSLLLAVQPVSAQTALAEDPVAYFPLNGNFNSIGELPLRCHFYGNEEYAEGKFGQALQLDGKNYIECKADELKMLRSLTFSTWATIPDNAALYASSHKPFIVLEDRNARRQTAIVLQKNRSSELAEGANFVIHEGRLSFNMIDRPAGSDVSSINAYSLADGETLPKHVWIHIAGVVDTDLRYVTLYVNGRLQERVAFDTEVDLSNANDLTLRIGGRIHDMTRHNGRLDDARIYSRALTEQEILTLYQTGVSDLQSAPSCLTIKKRGTGTGIVQIEGLECGSACKELHMPCDQNAWMLYAIADNHSLFNGWKDREGNTLRPSSAEELLDIGTVIAVFEKKSFRVTICATGVPVGISGGNPMYSRCGPNTRFKMLSSSGRCNKVL